MSDTPPISRPPISRFSHAAPFWLSLGMVPLVILGAIVGGWTVILVPLYGFGMFSVLDKILGLNQSNPDTMTADSQLFWYKAITVIWAPVQFLTLFWVIWYVCHHANLGFWEQVILFYGMGTMTGAVGIVYSHELMHRADRTERWLGDILLSMVLYCHFRSEHMLVHHTWVGTPRDAVTARYNESFPHFFYRILKDCPRSAWRAEREKLEKRGLSKFSRRNPFWRYAWLQLIMLAIAIAIGGWHGLILFLYQSLIAVWMLELTNYVEHYGLTRRYLGNGKFEPARVHHSWNAAHTATNWLLINLQRHSDHHVRPDRRFPLLQTYGAEDAPQLPLGYPVMAMIANIPPIWRRRMNPRVRAWRKTYYPDITDWAPYKAARFPGFED